MAHSKGLKIRKELEKFYEERITHYHQQGQHYEADRLAGCDIHQLLKERKNGKHNQ